MCGRFTIKTPASRVAELFDLDEVPDLKPRYNVAPTQEVPAIRLLDGKRHLDLLSWGLIPSWAKDRSFAAKAINARSETITEKPTFRTPFKRKRCLVVADGYYEWRTENKKKQPYYIRMKTGDPFAFAGLWDQWEAGDETVESCTIITTEAAPALKSLHERMPVILLAGEYDDWLSAKSGVEVLHPYRQDDLEFSAVSSTVNNARNETPACIEPIPQ